MFLWSLFYGILYAADGTDGGQTTDSGGAAADSPESDKPAESGTDKTRAATTQDDRQTNKITLGREAFNARIDKAKAAGQRALLQTLGFEDLDDPAKLSAAQSELKELIAFARERRQAEMTAEERYQQELASAQEQANTLKQRLQEMLMQERKRTLQGAIVKAAQAEGATQPDDVYAWAVAYAEGDVSALLNGGEGDSWELNEEGVKALIEKCKTERPDKFKPQHPGIPSNRGAKPPQPGAKDRQKARLDLLNLAQRGF